MRNSVLPVMSVLTVVAGAIGLQLGESAIAQIDPIHFQGAPPPLRDVSRDPRPQPMPGFAEASGWDEGYASLAEECGDCPALMTRRTHAAAAPAVDYYDGEEPFAYSYADAAPAVQVSRRFEDTDDAGAEDEVRIDRTVERSRQLERYLHYPVSAGQAEVRRIAEAVEAEVETVRMEVERPRGDVPAPEPMIEGPVAL